MEYTGSRIPPGAEYHVRSVETSPMQTPEVILVVSRARCGIPRACMLLAPLLLIAACNWFAPSPVATIEWTDRRQTIDGFGGSAADFLKPLTPSQADFYFTPAGIGLSILRIQIIPDSATCNTEFRESACSDSNGQILNGELSTAKMAVARGATVMASPWSPPAAYKSNQSFKNGGSLLRSHYADWARDIATYVAMMKEKGVPIYAVSVQNEPDGSFIWGSCRYSAEEIRDFVPFLSSSLREAGVDSTKIMIAEQAMWSDDLASAAMADPAVAAQVGIVAAHGYAGKIQPLKLKAPRVWQTEVSSQSDKYDGSMADGIAWGLKIHRFLNDAEVNAWLWWFLTDMPSQGDGTDNSALTDINGNIPKRAYVSGQWSKFVRPGWSRINVKYDGSLAITAFKDPPGRSFAIVAVNPRHWTVKQRFAFDAVSATQVTPWITSAQLSLAAQSPVRVSAGEFSYELPARSVTTFIGALTTGR
jgi:glucuronoarabinoxylan endo-1,4-beta-xylanase